MEGGGGGGAQNFESKGIRKPPRHRFKIAQSRKDFHLCGINQHKGYYRQKLCRQSCRVLLWLSGVAGVAQLVRAWVLCAQGRGFEPPHPHNVFLVQVILDKFEGGCILFSSFLLRAHETPFLLSCC
jgi:hypothetical protein